MSLPTDYSRVTGCFPHFAQAADRLVDYARTHPEADYFCTHEIFELNPDIDTGDFVFVLTAARGHGLLERLVAMRPNGELTRCFGTKEWRDLCESLMPGEPHAS